MKRALPLALLLLVGCRINGDPIGVNSVLEIDMQLPYAGASERPFALVSVEAGPIPIDFNPDSLVGNAQSFELDQNVCGDGEVPCNVRLSLTRGDASLDAVHIRASLCSSPECDDPAFPEDARAPYYLFEIRRPFYQGYRTFWHPTRGPFQPLHEAAFATQPTAALPERRIEVHRCEVACELNLGPDPLPDLGYCVSDPACVDVNCRGEHACGD